MMEETKVGRGKIDVGIEARHLGNPTTASKVELGGRRASNPVPSWREVLLGFPVQSHRGICLWAVPLHQPRWAFHGPLLLGFTSNPRSDPFFALPSGVVTWRQHYFLLYPATRITGAPSKLQR